MGQHPLGHLLPVRLQRPLRLRCFLNQVRAFCLASTQHSHAHHPTGRSWAQGFGFFFRTAPLVLSKPFPNPGKQATDPSSIHPPLAPSFSSPVTRGFPPPQHSPQPFFLPSTPLPFSPGATVPASPHHRPLTRNNTPPQPLAQKEPRAPGWRAATLWAHLA